MSVAEGVALRGARLKDASSTRVSVLDLDPDLGEDIDAERWEEARAACRARVLRLPRGEWDPTVALGRGRVAGVLIAGGVLAREIALRDRCLVEVLGPGDVLQMPALDNGASLKARTALIASSETHVVVLGAGFLRAAARWPSLLVSVSGRVEAQRERLALQALIAHFPRAEHRLLLILRHLADRWGRVTRKGIVLPIPLTHELLGQLVAARRPTVSLAARKLESRGLVRRLHDRSWVLTPLAEPEIEAIAPRRDATASPGETLVLHMDPHTALE